MTHNTKINLWIVSILFLCAFNTVYGQKENAPKEFHKNAVYGNVGVGGLYFTATAYYERVLTQRSKFTTFVKVGTGGYVLWGLGGQYILAQYGILLGAKKHHLEIGLGPGYFVSGDFKGDGPPLSGTIGWRIQKPGGKFIFRTGASWPEAGYIGLGFSF